MDRARPEAFADLVERVVERAGASRRTGSSSWPPSSSPRFVSAIPIRVIPRRSISGTAAASRAHAPTARIASVSAGRAAACASGSPACSRRSAGAATTVRPRRPAAACGVVTGRRARRAIASTPRAMRGRRPSAAASRSSAGAGPHRAGDRGCGPARAGGGRCAAEQRDSAASSSGRDLADGRMPAPCSLLAVTGPTPQIARPGAGGGTRARCPGRHHAAGRPAWPPRSRSWRGTSSARRRR